MLWASHAPKTRDDDRRRPPTSAIGDTPVCRWPANRSVCVGGPRDNGPVRFNLPDGAEHDGTDENGDDRFRISTPLDEHGFFGRECPLCSRTFLVAKESYDPLPDDLRLW